MKDEPETDAPNLGTPGLHGRGRVQVTEHDVGIDRCCYCKEVIEGPVEYCIPEGFPYDKRHEGKPLCERCGGSVTPTLNTICALLDAEQELLDQAQQAEHDSKIYKGELPRYKYVASEIVDLLKSLPSNQVRMDVLGMVFVFICRGCGGRRLTEGDHCSCQKDG